MLSCPGADNMWELIICCTMLQCQWWTQLLVFQHAHVSNIKGNYWNIELCKSFKIVSLECAKKHRWSKHFWAVEATMTLLGCIKNNLLHFWSTKVKTGCFNDLQKDGSWILLRNAKHLLRIDFHTWVKSDTQIIHIQ